MSEELSTVQNLMEEMERRCEELGISGYFDNLTSNEILEMALHYYMIYIESNIEKIKVDMYGGE
jgi:hypothetical protein